MGINDETTNIGMFARLTMIMDSQGASDDSEKKGFIKKDGLLILAHTKTVDPGALYFIFITFDEKDKPVFLRSGHCKKLPGKRSMELATDRDTYMFAPAEVTGEKKKRLMKMAGHMFPEMSDLNSL